MANTPSQLHRMSDLCGNTVYAIRLFDKVQMLQRQLERAERKLNRAVGKIPVAEFGAYVTLTSEKEE